MIMASSRTTREHRPNTNRPSRYGSTLAKTLAPEEIRCGDFVTPLEEITEWPSFFWSADDSLVPREEPVRIRFAAPAGGVPFKVLSLCLPFVLVRHPRGERQTIDVRNCRLAKLDRVYAKAAWKACKKSRAHNPKAC